jgi:Sulfotransferase family
VTASQGPIFVVGTMRSGSTMLRLILDSHPDIAVGAETGFMGAVMGAKAIPSWKHGTDWYQRIDWTEDEFDERLREFYGGMFERYASAQGKRRWGEKTPFHTEHMAAMARLFPDSVFVGIVRHPGAVAASLRKNFHYTFAEALAYWNATNLHMIRAATTLGTRFAALRYEELVTSGEPVLRELMDFLDEPWTPALLEHHRVQRSKGAPRVADGSTITSHPIDASRATHWAAHATAQDYDALRSIADLARFFGYDPTEPASTQPMLSPGGSRTWLATGDELLQRRREWADRVDFEHRPPPPLVDASPEELAGRLARVEQALARTRSRRSVRIGEAVRTVQRGRSPAALRAAWALLRSSPR